MSVQGKAALLALGVLAGGVPRAALAQQVDVKKFVDTVRPILLPDEEKQWKGLKDNKDKEEFIKIFWARRDPDLEAPGNEYRTEYEKVRADANTRFAGGGRPGADTDCGRVFMLLGAPDEMMSGTSPGGRKLETAKLTHESQTWTFRDRPSMKFTNGQVQISFDENCMLPQGARLGEQLARIAESKIAHPNIDYKKGADGHIVKLEDQLPKPTPVMALLKAPRQDFPAAVENALVLRTPDGATYVAGMIHLDAGALPAGATPVVGAQAVTADGKVAATTEREVNVQPGATATDVSYGMSLKPGDYTLRVAVLDSKSNKGTAVVQPLKVPDFGAEELALSPLLVLKDVQESPVDPKDALSAFQLGTTKLVPRYGNVFTNQDAVTLLGFIYGGKVDEATGKPSVTASFTILRDGAPVAKAPEQSYESTPTGPSVGPVPLTSYKPGKYVAQITVTDKVAKKDYKSEATFEVK
jgi:GWxTD domain-containing protein